LEGTRTLVEEAPSYRIKRIGGLMREINLILKNSQIGREDGEIRPPQYDGRKKPHLPMGHWWPWMGRAAGQYRGTGFKWGGGEKIGKKWNNMYGKGEKRWEGFM